MTKKKIVLSAINLFQGGALTILQDCLTYLDSSIADSYEVVVFVHNKSLFKTAKLNLVEIPLSRKSYLFRIYYEYFWFYFQSKKLHPYLWFSLHDMTPNVKAKIRAVYCHNPSPFYHISFREFIIEPTFGLFNLFYKYLYLINLKKNNYVIVQQKWIRDKFINEFKVSTKVVVAKPKIILNEQNISGIINKNEKRIFFYPTFPRVFKNIECVCEAARLLSLANIQYELLITISGNENNYSRKVFNRYKSVIGIKFIGKLSREKVYETYFNSDVLVFPSKLETWGLPLTEAKAFNKIILASDLPYAHETLGDYDRVNFFNPDDVIGLSEYMKRIIIGENEYSGNLSEKNTGDYLNSWDEIFQLLLQ
jgi:glycosyltransferase involved in cell wall biosynthesis